MSGRVLLLVNVGLVNIHFALGRGTLNFSLANNVQWTSIYRIWMIYAVVRGGLYCTLGRDRSAR
jgi:hypothetical protein